MLHTTKAIVLNHIKYAETSVIARIYTEKSGLQSFIINGVRSKKAKIKISMLQPLTMLDMVVYYKEKNRLQRIREISNARFFESISSHESKRAIALFISEVLYRSIREEEANAALFDFIIRSVTLLDKEERNCADFHLKFMVDLSRLLGFSPGGKFSAQNCYFDLKEGVFTSDVPVHPHYLNAEYSNYLDILLGMDFAASIALKIEKDIRKKLLNGLIDYYRLHLPGHGEIKAHRVLESVLN